MPMTATKENPYRELRFKIVTVQQMRRFLPGIRQYVLEMQENEGCFTVCGRISRYIERVYGLECIFGFYRGPEKKHYLDIEDCRVWDHEMNPSAHCYNVFPSGAILDASANQWGDPDPIRIILARDTIRQRWYTENL